MSRKVYKSSRTVYKGWAVQDLKYLPSMKELLQRFPSVRCRKSTRAASQCRCKSPSAWGPPRAKYVPKMVSPVRCPSQVSSVQCPSVQCLVPQPSVRCPVPQPSVQCLVLQPSVQCLVLQPSVQCPLSPYVIGVQFLQLLARQREGGDVWLRKGVGVVLYKIYLQFPI